MGRISISFLFALIITSSATVALARIPSPKLGTKHYFVEDPTHAYQNTELSAQVRTLTTTESSSWCMDWPKKRLEVLCEPVVKCMCAVVPDESMEKIDKLKELCLEHDALDTAVDICHSTKEAICFLKWWKGIDNTKCFNLARDCIPYMFEDYDWKIGGR